MLKMHSFVLEDVKNGEDNRSGAERNALAEGNRAVGEQKGPSVYTNDCWSYHAFLSAVDDKNHHHELLEFC